MRPTFPTTGPTALGVANEWMGLAVRPCKKYSVKPRLNERSTLGWNEICDVPYEARI